MSKSSLNSIDDYFSGADNKLNDTPKFQIDSSHGSVFSLFKDNQEMIFEQ